MALWAVTVRNEQVEDPTSVEYEVKRYLEEDEETLEIPN